MSKKKVRIKRLLVEGDEDKRVIPQLIEANGIPWGATRREAIVDIEAYGGRENLLKPEVISTELKATGLLALGLIVDADDAPQATWQRLRDICRPSIPDFPDRLPEEGLIHRTSQGINFGIWMMPDNQMRGMLETFLAYLIQPESQLLWNYVREVVIQARTRNAPFRETQTDKANIHTWLA